ncbi:hypothetical protein E2C01_038907 [Portunus trituberculatus]|uniref:Uncharacterized protein n=1 Tax=Portunus trituberculatus TaxID=210409 RepID=A0A5B7FI74_PORTR|nr:hypothetical protein [Portunus trituberculatus]
MSGVRTVQELKEEAECLGYTTMEEVGQVNDEGSANYGNGGSSHPSKPRIKLPSFKPGSDRIEFFIERFVQAADALEYDEVTKKLQFVTLFEGKPLEIIHRLDPANRDYKNMKEALLAAYGLPAEKLKEQFFSASMNSNETASQFASRLEAYLRSSLQSDSPSSEQIECLEVVREHFEREVTAVPSAAAVIPDVDQDDGPMTVASVATETFRDVRFSGHLTPTTLGQIRSLLGEYADVFSNQPKVANVPAHKSELTIVQLKYEGR